MKINITKFNWYQMNQIKQGLEHKLDVSFYTKPEFNPNQMREIREGLEQSLDVSIYAKPEFNWVRMCEIRIGLEENSGLTGLCTRILNLTRTK
jgi:hypothetical protein